MNPILELHDASVVLGDARVLDSVTLTIRDGEHTAILGPNGAGKSTLIKLLTLQLYPLAVSHGVPPIRVLGRTRWDVFEQALEHEQRVTTQINALYELCFVEKAFAEMTELQWFLTEQVEEEKAAREILSKLKLIANDPAALLDFDRDLGSRTAAA